MEKAFIHQDFLLDSHEAQRLYHEYAKEQPVIDYHCHLNPKDVAENRVFDNLTRLWLEGDHYKWRAMRANGIEERYITGEASDWEKFEKWSETVPYTLRNPLYHWTHLELLKPFGIKKLLTKDSAKEIYEKTRELLKQDAFSARGILNYWNVKIVCTTDDPIDTLEYHRQMQNNSIRMLPAWRPDKAMNVENPVVYNRYVDKLAMVSGVNIRSYQTLLDALAHQHDHFSRHGCRLSDHGIDKFYDEDYTTSEINKIFLKVRSRKYLDESNVRKLKSAMLVDLARMDFEKGWVQQFHYGPLRNNNSRMYQQTGSNTGFDSMGDQQVARSLSRFLDRLDNQGMLCKTILYNINPKDNDMLATMIGNFQDGSIPGKIQMGSGWWFLDQKQGIENQLNSLSNHGLLSRFVGMLTDSRSFLSFSRHEYFRRILCNLLGDEMQKGLVPYDFEMVGNMISNICYKNAKEYFGF